MKVVLFCGGYGMRMRNGNASDVPKPMAPVQGRPFLERLLDYWIGQGVQRAVLAVGYMHETVRKHFGEQYRNCALDYSVEQQPLGTGGALVQTLPLVQGKTFLVLNGDTYFAVPLSKLTEFHRQHRAEVSLSLFRSEAVSGRPHGLARPVAGPHSCRGNHRQIRRQPAVGRQPPRSPASSPWQGCAARLPARVSSLEKDLLPSLLGGLYGCIFDAPFVDIGLPEDWRAAANIIT